jgi:uncharacterized protein (DUF2237 family)
VDIQGKGEKNMRECYRVTKTDKARHIVCALWNMKALPTEDNIARWREVKAYARRPMVELDDMHQKALLVIHERMKASGEENTEDEKIARAKIAASLKSAE